MATDVFVSLRVYNVLGQEVKTLVIGLEAAGDKVVEFESKNLPSGIYFYRLEGGKFSDIKKMIFMK